jgi:hypothetical protein
VIHIQIFNYGFHVPCQRLQFNHLSPNRAGAKVILEGGNVGCVVRGSIDAGADVYPHARFGCGFVLALGY